MRESKNEIEFFFAEIKNDRDRQTDNSINIFPPNATYCVFYSLEVEGNFFFKFYLIQLAFVLLFLFLGFQKETNIV